MALDTIDLFCGIGGLSLGFQQAEIPIVAGFDNWERAELTKCFADIVVSFKPSVFVMEDVGRIIKSRA